MLIKEELNEFFIVNPFKPIWYIILLIGVVFCIVFINCFKTKTQKEKRNAIIVLYMVSLIIYVSYRIIAVFDPRYYELCRIKGIEPMNFWEQLPLHMCSLNLVLIIIAAIFNQKKVYMYVFFVSEIGALLAMITPAAINRDSTLFEPTIWGFYLTHLLVAMEMPIIYFFGLYKPRYKDIPITLLICLFFDFILTIVNMIIRSIGLSNTVNYFYTINPQGIPPLEWLYKFMPIPGVYITPTLIIIFLPYMLILTCLCNVISRKCKKTN